MSKTLQWIIGGSVVMMIASLAFSMAAPFFFPRAGGYGMMGGFGMPLPLFGLGMLGMRLGPLLLIGLLVLGAVWLMRASGTPAVAPTVPPCVHCGQPLQARWKACPHCGEKL